MKANKSHLLINEQSLQVLPSLAIALGLEEAIVIQQLHYWLNNSKNEGRIDDNGEKWVYNTYEEWQESNFPFWSVDKIQRIFLSLKKQEVIIIRQLDAKRRDMRNFYRIDYDKLCAMDDSVLRPSIDANLHDVKMNHRLPENTTESVVISKTDEEQPTYQITGIEAAIWHGRKVTDEDLPTYELREKAAISAFEQALNIPANWKWYPAKSTEEKTWRDFRLYILKAFEADSQCFTKYNTWRDVPYQKNTMSNLQIKRTPENFPTSWVAFLASSAMAEKQTDPSAQYRPRISA